MVEVHQMLPAFFMQTTCSVPMNMPQRCPCCHTQMITMGTLLCVIKLEALFSMCCVEHKTDSKRKGRTGRYGHYPMTVDRCVLCWLDYSSGSSPASPGMAGTPATCQHSRLCS